MEWSNTGEFLATASKDGTIAIWDTTSQQQIAVIDSYNNVIQDIAFSPDDQLLALVTWNGALQVWRISDGQLVDSTPGVPAGMGMEGLVAISQDHRLLASAYLDTGGIVTVWDAVAGELRWTFDDQRARVYSLAISPDGGSVSITSEENLATLCGMPNQQVVVWDLKTGKVVFSSEELHLCVMFSPDGKTITTDRTLDGTTTAGNAKITVGTWQVSPSSQRCVVDPGSYKCEDISPDGRLRVRGDSVVLRVFDAATDEQVAEFLTTEYPRTRPCPWFDPEGKALYVYWYHGGIIEVWGIP